MARYQLELKHLNAQQLTFFLNHIHNEVRIREFPIDCASFSFRDPNLLHLFAYNRGGKERDRRKADREFLFGCLKATVRDTYFPVWPRFFLGIISYYFTIRAFGRYSFLYADSPARNWEEFLQRCEFSAIEN